MWASPTMGSSLEKARSLYKSGAYDAAITLARDIETAEALTLAAETMSTKVMLGFVDNQNKSAIQAREWAEQAVKLTPQSQEAHIQYALAFGFETRTSSPFRAWRKKLPEKTYAVIDDIRTAYPEDPRGDALLGAWHLGIIRKAGHKNGKKWYNASEDAGIEFYETAMQAAPNDIVLAGNYVLIILALDAEKHQERANDILATVSELTPQNAVEIEIKNRLSNLQDKFSDPQDLEETVRLLLDGDY